LVAIPQRLVEVWAADRSGRGRSGSGWVVGQRGVLTARHVLEPSAEVVQVRRADAEAAEAWADAALRWRHPVLDVALLEVVPGEGQRWDPPRDPSPRLAGVGTRAISCEAVAFPDSQVQPSELRGSEQVPGRLQPAGGARDPNRLVPLDVDTSVPDDADLWKGFSGSAVHDEHGRLVGVVVRAHPERQRRRLLVALFEEACLDPAFPEAAQSVGLHPVVEDRLAPAWRGSVNARSLTPAGVPAAVGYIEDLRVFGVHAVLASDTGTGPYPPYLPRDIDVELDQLLAEAVEGGGRRLVLVVGDSAAGKSRSAAEAVRRHPVLRMRPLVVPLYGQLSRLLDLGAALDATVVWFDDLDKHLPRGLEPAALHRLLIEQPSAVVVATIQASQLRARQGDLSDPAWVLLKDDTQVGQIALEAALSKRERRYARSWFVNPSLLAALAQGVGLGEWLVGGPQLMLRLNAGKPLDRHLVDTVISWYRTGLKQAIAESDLRAHWASTLAEPLGTRLRAQSASAQERLFRSALDWACEPVMTRDLFEQALLKERTDGYEANDYVVDHVAKQPDRPMVPDVLWDRALQVAMSDDPARTQRLWRVGVAAYQERRSLIAMSSMSALADAGDGRAMVNVGILLTELGRSEEAVGVYDEVVARFGDGREPALREQVAGALINKGAILGKLGRSEEAVGVYDEVVARFGDEAEPALRERVAGALYNKGVTLGELGRSEEAVGVYDEVVARFGDGREPALREWVAGALINKGVSLGELGRSEEAVGVYDEVVARFGDSPEPAVRERVAKALYNKGVTLGELGRSEEAVGVYDEVVARFGDSPEPAVRERVAKALYNKGVSLGELGRSGEAVGVYDEVVARFGDEAERALRGWVAKTLYNKGVTLGHLGRSGEEVGVYDEVVARFGNAREPALQERVAKALYNKGLSLGELGRSGEAVGVYDEVVARFGNALEPALREWVAKALYNKGVTLGHLGRPEEEVGVYDEVVARFGDDPEPALQQRVARALVIKGVRLGQLGRPEEEVGVYDEVVARFGDDPEPGVRELVARALVIKGVTLGHLGRSGEEVGVYDEVVARFGDDPEPGVRELVARAVVIKVAATVAADEGADGITLPTTMPT
jgi:tetratricopeptide (TPR) repeat protein